MLGAKYDRWCHATIKRVTVTAAAAKWAGVGQDALDIVVAHLYRAVVVDEALDGVIWLSSEGTNGSQPSVLSPSAMRSYVTPPPPAPRPPKAKEKVDLLLKKFRAEEAQVRTASTANPEHYHQRRGVSGC